MKYLCRHIALFILFCVAKNTFAQSKPSFLETNVFYGIALEHDKSLKTAIQGNPYGIMLSYNVQNTKKKEWLSYYNYPDYGFSALYENTNSTILGEMYGVYGHYNFYLINRNAKNKLLFRFALGLAYITNPYHEIKNPYNFALASKFAGSAYFNLNYHGSFLKNKIKINSGISIIHFSNAGIKNPNLGLNTFAINMGIHYDLKSEENPFPKKVKPPKTKQKIGYNFILRSGINESKNIGSGKYPFYVATFMLDKKMSSISNITTGLDYFDSKFLKKYIDDDEPQPEITNTKRIGMFFGHALQLNKLAVVSQVGYHVYYPKKYVSRVYERFGLNYKVSKHFSAELTLKLNLFRAEMLEFGVGYRL